MLTRKTYAPLHFACSSPTRWLRACAAVADKTAAASVCRERWQSAALQAPARVLAPARPALKPLSGTAPLR